MGNNGHISHANERYSYIINYFEYKDVFIVYYRFKYIDSIFIPRCNLSVINVFRTNFCPIFIKF